MAAANGTDLFDAYFRRADLDGDGQISGAEAVAFFQGSNLPKHVLAQVWTHADQRKAGFLNRAEFYNALKLVTVAQSKRDLTPDMVKAALYGPASAKIPAPQINIGTTPASQANRVAAPVPQLGGAPSLSSQGVGGRGPQGFGSAGANQQFYPSQPNQFMRPPQAMSPGAAPRPQQSLAGQSVPSGGTMVAPRPPTSSASTDWLGGSSGSPLGGASSQVSTRAINPSNTQDGFGLSASGFTPSVQARPPATSGQAPATTSKPQDPDSKALVVSGNGFPSDSLFGDVFSATPAQPNQSSLAATSSAGSLPVSTATIPSSPAPQPSIKPSLPQSQQTTFSQQPVTGQYQQVHSAAKHHQQFAVQSTTAASAGFPLGASNSASSQPQSSWPKMTQSDVQKYTKVFVQVDTDRDGKITGEQARNLFLSWRLPREILKQVWDLSDQDNDSMLSLKEFCTSLYLLERFREGRPLPASLPRTIMPDDALFSATAAPYTAAARGPVAGFQQPQAPRPPAGKPPRPAPIPQMDRPPLPTPQKPKVPSLEKHLVDQLSKEEQDSLNAKLKDATEADKKVEELEKEMITSREKIQFYHSKMQELILYKSRCDNRLNEITERVSGDKREVDLLAKKYEEKYKQSGDVASKLTIEESTFRDIQEKKMELYQAIVKMQGDSEDGSLQEHADGIQTRLEELVKNLNERCKQYGLRAKPTSLLELPFGWQPGIQEGAADWDGEWDKFEDEGFTFVKEFTLDVENLIAPPKPNSLPVRKEMTSTNENASSPNADDKSVKDTSKGEEITEKGLTHEGKENGVASSSPPESPAGSGANESQSKELQDSQIKNTDADGSPQAKDRRSGQGGPESVVSGDKTSDEPGWGTFDTNYDSESVWGFDNDNAKDLDHDRHGGSALFGFEDFGLKPIKTDSSQSKNSFSAKNSIFADSVPSTPAYSISGSPRRFSAGPDDYSFDKGKSSSIFADSVPSTPAYNSFDMGRNSSIFADSVPSTPAYNSFDKGNSSSMFADSVPSTPAYNFENTPRRFSAGSEDHSFDTFSRFDSFNMQDGGLFQSPSLSRFDSVRSTRDSDHGLGYLPQFDSFNAHEGNLFQSSESSLSRFDSVRSTKDYDHTHGFPSFDDSDPFGSTGPFKTSMETPRRSEADYFGSSGPFNSSIDQTPRKYDMDSFGSSGPFKTSGETPRKSSDSWSAF